VNAETELEAWVRAELAGIAEGVMPRPDPYGRLVRRRRVGWLRRVVAGCVAALVAGGAGTFVALAPAGSPAPAPPDNRLAWIDALVDGPPRGALATDKAFTTEVVDRVTQFVRANLYNTIVAGVDGHRHPDQEVHLLFADDIGDERIVIFALRMPTDPDPASGLGRSAVSWLAGRRGAPAAELTSLLTTRPMIGITSGTAVPGPLVVANISGTDPSTSPCDLTRACATVALAPPGCSISTAPSADLDHFQPEPTGSYLVRTPETERAEYWRVTCGGVVRDERPAQFSSPLSYSNHDVDMALDGTVGLSAADRADPDVRAEALESLFGTVSEHRASVLGPARVVWTRSCDTDPYQPDSARAAPVRIMFAVAPAVRSTWFATIMTWQPENGGGGGTTFRLGADPTAPNATFALDQPGTDAGVPHRVLVDLPPSAVAVRLVAGDGTAVPLAGSSGTSSTEAAVACGIAELVLVHTGPIDGLRVVGYDAAGSPVANVPVVGEADGEKVTDNWG
jgi:hypothetical protein